MRYKRGDVRSDGKVFWQYHKAGKKQVWMTPERFKEKQLATAKRMAEYTVKNANQLKQKRKSKYIENREAILEYMKNRYLLKIDSIKKYRQSIKSKRNQQLKSKYKNDPLTNISERIRARIREAIKRNGFTKKSKTLEILGCSWPEFRNHLESQFKDGMSWQNRHLWHIDHIIPISSAKTESELIKLNHYTNLQPLWARENLQKSNKHESRHPKVN
jgi:hypothetical protein